MINTVLNGRTDVIPVAENGAGWRKIVGVARSPDAKQFGLGAADTMWSSQQVLLIVLFEVAQLSTLHDTLTHLG